MVGTLLCLPVTAAYAQDCENLGENTEWTALFQQMNTQAQAEDYEMALHTFKKMSEICSIVPSANYSAGMIHKKLKNYKDAYAFLTVATRNTKEFAVDEDLMKRMWYALYETEYPAVIDFRSGKVEQLHQESIDALQNQHKDAIDALHQKLEDEKQEKLEFAETMMWTGAGIGIAGVVLAAVGGVLMSPRISENENNKIPIDDKDIISLGNENYIEFNVFDKKPMYMTGVVFLGVGIASAVSGAIVTGIGGYKYTQIKAENDVDSNNTVSFQLSPQYSSLTFKF